MLLGFPNRWGNRIELSHTRPLQTPGGALELGQSFQGWEAVWAFLDRDVALSKAAFLANILSTWGKSPSLLKRLQTGLWPSVRLSPPHFRSRFSSSGFHDTGQRRKEPAKRAPKKRREAYFSLRTRVESKWLIPTWFRVGASQERKKKQNMVVNLKSRRIKRTDPQRAQYRSHRLPWLRYCSTLCKVLSTTAWPCNPAGKVTQKQRRGSLDHHFLPFNTKSLC